jgi:hypothetical protein
VGESLVRQYGMPILLRNELKNRFISALVNIFCSSVSSSHKSAPPVTPTNSMSQLWLWDLYLTIAITLSRSIIVNGTSCNPFSDSILESLRRFSKSQARPKAIRIRSKYQAMSFLRLSEKLSKQCYSNDRGVSTRAVIAKTQRVVLMRVTSSLVHHAD